MTKFETGKIVAKLDILIPHFNDVSGLDLALQSVGKQDWKGDMRIVVCDDGSDKRFQPEIEAACKRSTVPVVLIRNASNKGRPYTRNVLLDAVESPYLAWLDAGDEWYHGKLSAQMLLLRTLESQSHAGPFWVTCSYDWKWVTGLHRFLRQKVDQDQLKALLVGDDLRAYLWTIVARTEHFKQVGKFDEQLPRLQDLDYFVRFVLAGGRLYSTDGGTALCAYHKSDFGRDATVIRACYQHVFENIAPTIAAMARYSCATGFTTWRRSPCGSPKTMATSSPQRATLGARRGTIHSALSARWHGRRSNRSNRATRPHSHSIVPGGFEVTS